MSPKVETSLVGGVFTITLADEANRNIRSEESDLSALTRELVSPTTRETLVAHYLFGR